ncbi:MAG: hypothetical protein ABFE08_08675 [Armatimonadia bacterium]
MSIDFTHLVQQQMREASSEANPAVTFLTDLAAQLQKALQPIEVVAEPRYVVNMGQQWRLVLRLPDGTFEHVLFKAYVPLGGFPVQLDFYRDSLVPCNDRAELEQAIATFLQEETTRQQMAQLRAIALSRTAGR